MRHRNRNDGHEVARYVELFIDDDTFLTALSRGEDPSGGEDELASLLLDLRTQVERPMPPAPDIGGVEEEATGENSSVVDLAQARHHRRGPGPLMSGLIGAAAATVIVAGSGAALYNASPESPLWGASTALFGERTTVLELAGTLDELEVANEKGDVNGARNLLNQARALIDAMGMSGKDGRRAPAPAPASPGAAVTVTQTVPAPAEHPEQPAAPLPPTEQVGPEVTVTETVTVTESAQRPTVEREATESREPTPTSSTTPPPEDGESLTQGAPGEN